MRIHDANIHFVIVILFAFILCGCGNLPEKEPECAKPVSDSINPNGSSELSMLMRQMHDRAAEMKKLIEQGKQLGNFSEEFQKINTVAPTDSETKKPSFDTFAQEYLASLKMLYQPDSGEVTGKYNALINSCLACHSDHCPGPVPKIKKLIIR